MTDLVPAVMLESILDTIKKKLGVESDYHAFDVDIATDINSVFMILNQLGLGPTESFSIQDSTATWSDFLSTVKNLEAVKSYIYLKVKLIFDPPTNSATLEAMNRSITELEWRLNIQAEQNALDILVLEDADDDI